jgi:3D (Asp-Asp-Asp) domain-containing protein
MTYTGIKNKKHKAYTHNKSKSELKARITVYWQYGAGTDRWSRKGTSATGVKLKKGMVAVNPRIIPYFSKIDIPALNMKNLIATDTGSAVIKNTAARRSGQSVDTTIDIFFPTKAEAINWSRNNPSVVNVVVNKS